MAVSTTTKQNLTLVGVVFLAFAIPLTVVAFRIASDIRSRAKPTETPAQVFVTNLSGTSATVTWITNENLTEGFVKYGTSAEAITSAGFDERDTGATSGTYKTHSILLSQLTADTDYFYKIVVGEQEYDNAGIPFTFTTLPGTDATPPTPDPIEGSITPSGEDALIYSFASNGTSRSTIVSGLTNSSGNYAFDRTSLKNSATGDQFTLSNADIITFAQGADLGTAEVQYIASDKPGILTLSTEGAGTFNPDRTITLLERPGGPIIPPVTGTNTLVTSSITLSGADSDPTIPRNVRISNVSDTSLTVSWITKEAATGNVLFGIGDPTKLALDDRDGSASLAKKRFTHSATVSDSTFVAGNVVAFQISSNSKLYDNNGTDFSFTIPKLLSTPPSLGVVSGVISPEFESTVGLPDPRDFLVVGRISKDGESSSWVTTVPAVNKSWNLNTATARSQALDEYFVTTDAQTSLELYGAFNSTQATTLTTEDTYNFGPDTGLAVTSFNHSDEISVLEPISGTAAPSATVVLTFDGPESKTVTTNADENGEWEVSISNIESSGEYDILVQAGSSVLGLSAEVTLEALPDTAIQDLFPYVPGILLVLSGIGIIYWVKQTRLKKLYE